MKKKNDEIQCTGMLAQKTYMCSESEKAVHSSRDKQRGNAVLAFSVQWSQSVMYTQMFEFQITKVYMDHFVYIRAECNI